MARYDHASIETKWQKRWDDEAVFVATDDGTKDSVYVLDMFPYPSSDGLHVGHPEGYTATDILSRYLRMKGKNVLHPMGWDAFGLPAENAAIKKGVHPRIVTEQNVKNFKRQIKSLGFSYDWTREINTTDPKYYKWTQWIFLQLYKAGLAYEAELPIWWCPKDKTGLANEEVVDGCCERCGTKVERKQLRQWVLKITKYADRLLAGLDKVDWPESIKALQRNWIGRSEGAEVDFEIQTTNNYVLLHGYTGSPEANFFPWLKKELDGRKNTVSVPVLPSTDDPDVYAQVEAVLKNEIFDSQTVLLGHSLGGVVALKVLERLKKPIKKLVLAASFSAPKFKDKKRPFEDRFDWKFDWDKIRKNAGEVVILRDSTDDTVPEERAHALLTELGGRIVHFAAVEPHICAKEEPEVLKAALDVVTVFTTRPDTLFGATYLVLAPEHQLVDFLTTSKQAKEVSEYKKKVSAKSDLERTSLEKEKTGVFTGAYAVNPANGKKIPVWIADYVLASYGTGAIMAVPAHDERDYEFATKFNLPIVPVIKPPSVMSQPFVEVPGALSPAAWGHLGSDLQSKCWIGDGTMQNSGEFNGQDSVQARKNIVDWLAASGTAKATVQYKLRDWIFSRQRYWGEPIPLVHCETDGVVAIPEDQLPVELPDVEKYEPTGTGESPLAAIDEWVNTTCPTCGGPAKRETNTMPQWAGSCWYYLRYLDPNNEKQLADPEKLKAWLPVDVYVGGAEHAVLHLMYSRFWHMALYDSGALPKEIGDEPFLKLKNQGLILGEDGEKMSKSRGNVVNPDEIIEKFGADSLRLFEMFMGPFEDAKPWKTNGLIGMRRFLERVAQAKEKVIEGDELPARAHRFVAAVTEDIEQFHFNTAVSTLMKWSNEWKQATRREFETFLKAFSVFAPHLAEELWHDLGHKELIATEPWPTYDAAMLQEDSATIAVQVNGKLRGTVVVSSGTKQSEVESSALGVENVKKYVTATPKKVVFVQDKLINFIV